MPDRIDIRIGTDAPYPVRDVVIRYKIIERLFSLSPCDDLPERVVRPVCQENRTRLSLADLHMADAVKLLVRTRILVLFDHLVLIVVDARTRHDACLHAPVHRELIDVIDRLILLDKRAISDHFPQQIVGFLINFIGVCINTAVKLCLRPVNVQKGERIALHGVARLLPVVDIIRKRCDLLRGFFLWSVRLKRPDHCHILIPPKLKIPDLPILSENPGNLNS